MAPGTMTVEVPKSIREWAVQPTTPRDFLKVSLQRLSAAEQIMEVLQLNLEAQYIGGYSIECSLKALILQGTAESDRSAVRYELTHGAKYHRVENLLKRLKEQNVIPPLEIKKKMHRFDWTTSLRYETGRKNAGETKRFLRIAKSVYDWVKDQIP